MTKDMGYELLKTETFTLPGVFFKYYKALGLTDIQFLLLLHIRQFHQEGNQFPTPEQLVGRMTLEPEECTTELQKLLTSRFITIVEIREPDNKISEVISIEPLYEKLYMLLFEKKEETVKSTQKEEEGALFKRFEEEFARPLSPMEMEMISMWLDEDKHAPHLIKAALREAVVSSRMNFRYIDRILFDWKKNNITTVEQAKKHGEKVRSYQKGSGYKRSTAQQPGKRHPGYNWLEGDDHS